MPKKLSTIWRFILPIFVLLILAPFFFSQYHSKQQLQSIEHDAHEQVKGLARLLAVSEQLISQQVDSAIRLLIQQSNALGEPRIANGYIFIGDKHYPNLVFGNSSTLEKYQLISSVVQTVGGTATIFVRDGQDFVRIATNVPTREGKSAIGTQLNPKGEAIVALRQGRSFTGVVDILGSPYFTRYDPMYNQYGQLIGAWYVGYKVDMQIIREAIERSKFLKSGFVALVDHQNTIRMLSKHMSPHYASSIISQQPSSWNLVSVNIDKWKLKLLVAYPINEAKELGYRESLLAFGVGALIVLALTIILLWQFRRLVVDPIGADPEIAIDVVKRIASGDLSQDNLRARPNTLMSNVLTMRRKLREMVNTLQENADRLLLSANVVEHTHNGIFIADVNQRIIEVNPSFTEHSGYTREDAIGRFPSELKFAFETPNFFRDVWQNEQSNGDWQGETRNQKKDGTIYPARLDLFVVKDNKNNVSYYVGVFSDITETVSQRAALEYLAYHDSLTQLPNRALFTDRLSQSLSKLARTDDLLAVCYFDLDGFKQVNDSLGHEAGDQLLVELSQRLRTCMRESDTIARMGGDEFSLLLNDIGSIDECKLTLNRILDAIHVPFMLGETLCMVSASIGYTIAPLDDSEPDILLRHADQAMYLVKMAGGRNHLQFDAELDKNTRDQLQTRSKIEQAIQQHEIKLFYQPKIDMRRGSVFSFEGLARWFTPSGTMLMPSEFLPQIEHTDSIIQFGEWVILEALRQLGLWHEMGLDTRISVNIGARHLAQANFAERLKVLLERHPRVSPKRIMLEITETAVIEDINRVTQTMLKCKALGVSFALDDFGVGYSSLTYLRRLPVDIIKIDQSFVRNMLDDNEDLTLIAGVISLSREFDRQVIAEGVESADHGLQLLRMGCTIAQGFGISPAMAPEEVPIWVANYKLNERWKLLT